MTLRLSGKQRQREDHKEDLKHFLYGQGVDKAPDGRNIEELSLFSLAQVVMSVKTRRSPTN